MYIGVAVERSARPVFLSLTIWIQQLFPEGMKIKLSEGNLYVKLK